MSRDKQIISWLLCAAVLALFFYGSVSAARLFPVKGTDQASEQDGVVSDTHINTISVKLDKTVAIVDLSDTENILKPTKDNIYGLPVEESGELNYCLYVEKGSHSMSVFTKDRNGYYTVLCTTFPTATGRTDNLTPTGIFEILDKSEWYEWHGIDAVYFSPYTSKFYESGSEEGGLFIHAPLFYGRYFGTLNRVTAAQIGTNSTSGCLRTTPEAAYFVYEKCPIGTKLVIVEGAPLGMETDFITSPDVVDGMDIQPSIPAFAIDSENITGLSFREDEYTLLVGDNISLQTEIVVTPEEYGNAMFYWSCNAPDVLSITRDGKVFGLSPGSAIVSINTVDGKISSSVKINVRIGEGYTENEPEGENGGEKPNNYVESPIPAPSGEQEPLDEKRILMFINGIEVRINTNSADLLDYLGNNYILDEELTCAWEKYGKYDKTFTYTYNAGGEIKICTLPMEQGKDIISEVCAKGDCGMAVKTSDGISIGDNFQKVLDVYGRSYTVNEIKNNGSSTGYTKLTYWAGEQNGPRTPRLYFTVNNSTGNVESIGVFNARNLG